MLVMTLQLHGHQVFEAATGHEGIAQARLHTPDLVLIDIGLPDVEGYAVARALRDSLNSTVRLIALTGYGGPADRARSQEAGFHAHLLKPVDPSRLVGVLETLM
jgi:CheY-like chemotaxis protein